MNQTGVWWAQRYSVAAGHLGQEKVTWITQSMQAATNISIARRQHLQKHSGTGSFTAADTVWETDENSD